MAGSPLEVAQTRLDAYLATEASILAAGQEGSHGQRRRREAELAEVRSAIRELQQEVQRLSGGGSQFIRVVPCD